MGNSRKVRRLKRKLKKNLDMIAFGLFLVAGVGFFGNKYISKRSPQGSAQRNIASVPQNSSQKQYSETEKSQIKANVKDFLGKVKNSLGQDAAGISAFVLFMRQVAPEAVEKDEKLNQLCKTQDACPLPLKDVYSIGLARLDKAGLSAAKEALQSSLMNSSVHILEKQTIIARHLIGTDLHKSNKVSRLQGENVEISPSAQYFLVTAKQLQMLKVPEQEYLQIMYKALQNSNDQVAKKLIFQGLQKGYPKFQDQINQAAQKLGVSIVAKR